MMAKRKGLLDHYPEPHHADGKRLKQLREDLRIGQVQLAKLAGVGQVSISRIELGVRPFTKGARNKLWPVMEKLLKQHVEELKASIPSFGPTLEKARAAKANGTYNGFDHLLLARKENLTPAEKARLDSYESHVAATAAAMTIEQRLQFEKALLEGQLQGAREIIAEKDKEIATIGRALDVVLDENEKLNLIVGHRGEEAVLEEQIAKVRAARKTG